MDISKTCKTPHRRYPELRSKRRAHLGPVASSMKQLINFRKLLDAKHVYDAQQTPTQEYWHTSPCYLHRKFTQLCTLLQLCVYCGVTYTVSIFTVVSSTCWFCWKCSLHTDLILVESTVRWLKGKGNCKGPEKQGLIYLFYLQLYELSLINEWFCQQQGILHSVTPTIAPST